MKALLLVFALAVASASLANPIVTEPHLSEQDKVRLLRVLREALRDKDVSQQQFDHSIRWMNSTPCDTVERSLPEQRKAQLETAIALQQGRATVSVYESFELGGWYVLFTNASVGDEPYMFYSQDPIAGIAPLTLWSGAATIFETEEVATWVKQNANGIPKELAECFAWYVTLSPN